jgi:O-antigen/teichoic acid export membrane protein
LNKIKNLAGQTATYGVSSIVGRIINYLLVPLYTRAFVTAEFGVVTEMYAYVAFLIVILTYGMETAFFRFSQVDKKKNTYSTTLISLLGTSSLFIIITTFFSHDIANLLQYPNHSEYIIWLALIVSLDALSSIPFAKLRAQNKSKRFVIIKLINIAVNIGLNLYFYVDFHNWGLKQGAGVEYVFISNLISSSITVLLLSPEIIKIKYVFDYKLWEKMIIYALPLLVAGLAGIINETMDRILLKYLLPKDIAMSQLGIYGACYKISILMTIFIQAFRYAADPFFFSNSKEKNSKKLYADVMKYFVIVVSFIFLGIMMYEDIVILFIGEPFRVGAPVIPVLLLANLFLGIYFNLSIWYKLTNKTLYGAYIAIFGATITLVLNFLLIPVIGYMGSAWATFICYASMMIVSYLIGQKYFPVKYDFKRITGYLGLSVSLFFISKLLNIETQNFRLIVNTIFILIFIFVVIIVEEPHFLRAKK